MRFRNPIAGARHDRGRWLLLLALLAGVLAPTACVLWFMHVAIDNQRDAARQKLTEAYRGQLTLLRGRVDAYWENRAGDLERETREGAPAAIFERLVRRGVDSAVILNVDGAVLYPRAVESPMPVAEDESTRGAWMAARSLESVGNFPAAATAYDSIAKTEADVSAAARAAQARIRCLVRNGDKQAAIQAVEENFTSGRLAGATDSDGRVIEADQQLMAMRLMSPQDRRYAGAVERLHKLVADYAGSGMPASQRLFLMEEAGTAQFATYGAEKLATRFLENGRVRAEVKALEASGVPEVWKLTLPGARAIVLYRTATVIAAMRELSSGLNAAITLTPPGGTAPASAESMPAGSSLPGWQMSLTPLTGESGEAARRQTMAVVWVGLLAIAVVAITALIAGQAFRRQWQLARLKTDLVAAVSHELKTPLSSMRVLVDALLDDANPGAQKTHEYLEMIARENLRLSRLIENFLTFSRLERNRQKFEFTSTRPDEVIQAVQDAVQERFRTPDCRLEVSVGRGLPALRADEDALVTVLLNLLDNAYKYTPGEKQIGLRAFLREGSVVFAAVEDNGIGIAPREQKRIFRRFYQGGSQTGARIRAAAAWG